MLTTTQVGRLDCLHNKVEISYYYVSSINVSVFDQLIGYDVFSIGDWFDIRYGKTNNWALSRQLGLDEKIKRAYRS